MTKVNVKTTKKKRVSKKNKTSWRKHVDITDVEEFLEDKRLEERLGPPLETLPDEALFTIDTKPGNEEKHLSAKERKRLKFLQPPKCFAALRPYTQVPDPIKRNRVKSKEERKNEILKKKEAYNREMGILKHREQQAVKDRKLNEIKKNQKHKRGDFLNNIWEENEEETSLKNEWFEENTKKNYLVGTGKTNKTVHAPKKIKSSILPTVEIPHPGMSYNPSFEDHQDLLRIVAEKESEVIKEEKHLDRVTKQMFSRVTEDKRDANWLNEMSEGISQTPTNEGDSDGEFKSINPPTQNKKKTLKQKRKQKEQRELSFQRKQIKLQRKKVSDIHLLRQLNKEIIKTDAKQEKLRKRREKIKLLKKNEPKRLGSLKFEENELEFKMGQDLSGNLINLKKEGNLLADRFKSLQKRNVIQPTIRKHRKKPKVKVYTKPGHTEDWKKTVAKSNI